MTKLPKAPIIAMALALGVFLVFSVAAWADNHEIRGRVTNLTPGAGPVAGVQVNLAILEEGLPLGQLTATTGEDGSFTFEEVPRIQGLVYLIRLQYQGAQYQTEYDPASTAPAEIAVYEATSDLDSLSLVDDTIVVTREPGQYERLSIRQVVRVRNDTPQTFVPSFGEGGTGVMNFLRVSMPEGFAEMSVTSDLQGGQVIPVDRGVGITTPVPPGVHAIVFAYTAPYDRSDLVFEPLYPVGADVVRVLVQEDVGKLIGAGIEEEEAVSVSGSSFRVYAVDGVEAGDRITLGFTDLPRAPWTTTIADAFRTQWQITAVIPGVTALVLLLLLGYAWRLQRRDPRPVDPATLAASIESQPDQMELVMEIAALDGLRERGEIEESDYAGRRAELKNRVLSRALRDAASS